MMPERIARLPKDSRGYPIPWNILVGNDGTPIFTANDHTKHLQAIRSQLCPICGERLGRWKWFAGGPLSAFLPNGAYFDLPGHSECIKYALTVCPYLALPKYLGRIDIPNPDKVPDDVSILIDPTMIPDRPEVFVAVATDHYEVVGVTNTMPTLQPLRPYLDYEFWRHGKQIDERDAIDLLRPVLGANWVPPDKRML